MKWSWKIATISGIGIYVHGTFLILLAYFAINSLAHGGRLIDAVALLLLLVVLFSIVVMHELGHAFAARRYGINTQDITLLPIGGVARLERIPEEPKKELVIALAGPAVNVVLAVLCVVGILLIAGTAFAAGALRGGHHTISLYLWNFPPVRSVADLPAVASYVLFQMLTVNVMMIAFNLLPAFPMDGGRVLRALLAMKLNYVRATQVAARIGQAMAVVFVLVGLFGIHGLMSPNPFLMFIALFVWIGAQAEATQVETRAVMGGVTAGDAMVTRFQTVTPDNTLTEVSDHIIRGFQQDFPVVTDGHVVGMLTRHELFKAMVQGGQQQRVGDVMHRTFERAEAGEQLGRVFERLQNCACHSLPVLRQGQLVGVIDMENVGEFIALRSTIRSRREDA